MPYRDRSDTSLRLGGPWSRDVRLRQVVIGTGSAVRRGTSATKVRNRPEAYRRRHWQWTGDTHGPSNPDPLR